MIWHVTNNHVDFSNPEMLFPKFGPVVFIMVNAFYTLSVWCTLEGSRRYPEYETGINLKKKNITGACNEDFQTAVRIIFVSSTVVVFGTKPTSALTFQWHSKTFLPYPNVYYRMSSKYQLASPSKNFKTSSYCNIFTFKFYEELESTFSVPVCVVLNSLASYSDPVREEK